MVYLIFVQRLCVMISLISGLYGMSIDRHPSLYGIPLLFISFPHSHMKTQSQDGNACTHENAKNCEICGKPMCDDCGVACTCNHTIEASDSDV
jgi:hypothetical protein